MEARSLPTVYLETSIVGYATSWPSRAVIVAGRQQITHEWFASQADSYALFVSQLVIDEASAGDGQAVRERRTFLRDIPQLAVTDAAGELAKTLIRYEAVPETSAEDAFHIAIATVHGLDYLLTWNFTHIANATMRSRIHNVCDEFGYSPPIICTPEELINEQQP